MPFQRTVRAEKTRGPAPPGASEAEGSKPVAGAVRGSSQVTDRSPNQYLAADAPIGTTSMSNKTITNFLTVGNFGRGIPLI